MKKIYLYVAFALASIGMISCTDILDQDPLDSFTDEAVWNDLALSETYLNAQYMNLMAENMKGTRFAHYTDEVFQKHTYGSENVMPMSSTRSPPLTRLSSVSRQSEVVSCVPVPKAMPGSMTILMRSVR